MPDGGDDPLAADCRPTTMASTSYSGESSLGFSDEVDRSESSSSAPLMEKDPRKIARRYQLELCKKAVEENIIVYLGTGCGKTHIAVLLIYELGHLIRKPQKNICVFLAPTVALVQQQASVIEESVDFKVGICGGSSKRVKNHDDWDKEMKQYEVIVMTPQILLHHLSHCFITMDSIALLIFDECHHAQANSNHPYAEIMKMFYKKDGAKLPRIFGMTASPVVGKDASSEVGLPKSINSLEHVLDAKVYSVEEKNELDRFVATATVQVYHYGPVVSSTSSPYIIYCRKLEEMKRQCISTLSRNDLQRLRSTKKLLNKIHDNLIFCLQNLGIFGALQATRIFKNSGNSERNELIEEEGNYSDETVFDRYLVQAADILSSDSIRDGGGSDLSSTEDLKEPFFASKLLRLIGILSSFRLRPNMKCIIFVKRIATARSLSCILKALKILEYWKCDFLVGIHSELKSMSRTKMKIILEKFRSGELNLLIATKVGEEGLDIQTCCLVIRFDIPDTVSSFIQSRGRARMPQSEYAFLVDSGNQKELDLIETFKKDECKMNMEISCRTSGEITMGSEEKVYKVDSTGASISSGYSISLLHQYCSKLPHDEFFDPKPKFFYLDDLGGTVCHVVLPSNAPMHLIVSSPQSSTEAAKKDACLKAIEELHKLGVLNDYLLPMQDNENPEEPELDSSDFDIREDENVRMELYEMLIPAALSEPWDNTENPVYLFSYYIEFSPNPPDRTYKRFGLFVKARLPFEAEEMKLNLHLARGRSVMTKLIPSGFAEFYEDEIVLAQKFQEIFLKLILDRSEFEAEFVSLGGDDFSTSSSTYYLLLPVIFNGSNNTLSIDWKTIRKCLSSPIFRRPESATDKKICSSDAHLQLADGSRRICDIENSLVYTPYTKNFFFITHIAREKNGNSLFKDSDTVTYMDHLDYKFGIQLKYPEQPLLCAKPLFSLHNLLHTRKQEESGAKLDEYLSYLPPELCQLKILGFSKDIGSSISLLPSFMHRLESLLVAIELKSILSASFPEGSEVTTDRVLEALTTEKCQERFSLERLEILGDAFLKYVVGRHLFLLHGTLDEGQLTSKRSNAVSNSNLFKLACKNNLQVYIRDQPFEPSQFFALGRPCPTVCNKETEESIHSQPLNSEENQTKSNEVRCRKGHVWLHKKTVSDVVEALVGAFIVDSGFKAAIAFLRWIGVPVDFEASKVTDFCIASTKYIPLATRVDIKTLEDSLGYEFRHKGLLLQAFVHPSYNKLGGGCYQRLEFLGDAVLDYLITSYLYSAYPKLKPGQLTDLRSLSVNNQSFASVAVDRSFQDFLVCDSSILSKAIENYVKYYKSCTSESSLLEGPKCKVLGDLVESCVGAILLDTGFDLNCVWEIMLSFLERIMMFSSWQHNPIRKLLELCQSHSLKSEVAVSKKDGRFLVERKVKNQDNQDVCASASATNSNIREAKKITADEVFTKLKALGYEPKTKSLEQVLNSSCKLEAKLVGFNESPIDVTIPDSITSADLIVEEPLGSNSDLKIYSMSEAINDSSSSSSSTSTSTSSTIKSLIRHSPSNSRTIKTDDSDKDSQTSGGPQKESATAKSRLYEVCTAFSWNPPTFECWKEEGPSHLKLFTYKVTVEIEEAPDMIVEARSAPHKKKKDAAEHAAEGALWWLEKQGYLQQ
ncbi:hypothetical protein UlMin_002891 [Ulmus minor]